MPSLSFPFSSKGERGWFLGGRLPSCELFPCAWGLPAFMRGGLPNSDSISAPPRTFPLWEGCLMGGYPGNLISHPIPPIACLAPSCTSLPFVTTA